MHTLDTFLKQIEDGKPVRVALPIQDIIDKERFNCLYLKTTPPQFSLQFTPGNLPVHKLDTHRKCTVLFDIGGQSVSLSADIDKINASNTLELSGQELINHEQLREYFRVDVTTPIVVSSLLPDDLADEEELLRLTGKTIDVSGSGLLCRFPAPLEVNKQIRIELVLPTADQQVVQAIGNVVRCKQIAKNTYHVAIFIDTIDPEMRDKVMASCFDVQRKQLRLKVQLKNY